MAKESGLRRDGWLVRKQLVPSVVWDLSGWDSLDQVFAMVGFVSAYPRIAHCLKLARLFVLGVAECHQKNLLSLGFHPGEPHRLVSPIYDRVFGGEMSASDGPTAT